MRLFLSFSTCTLRKKGNLGNVRWFQQMHVQNHFKSTNLREEMFTQVRVNLNDLSASPNVAYFHDVFHFLSDGGIGLIKRNNNFANRVH